MNSLTEEQKETIKRLISDSSDYLVRNYIDELTSSISDVWCVDDVINYCNDYRESEFNEQQALDVLSIMKDKYDPNWGFTWAGLVNAVNMVLEDYSTGRS